MILSNGTNQYPNNEFSFWEWSAPILQTPQEVLQKLQKLLFLQTFQLLLGR